MFRLERYVVGARGTVTAVRTVGSGRTHIFGPGAGLVYVEWDGDGLVCGVSLRDLKLEPPGDERRRWPGRPSLLI